MVLFQSSIGICLYGRVSTIFSDSIAIFSSPLETSEEMVRQVFVVPFTSGMRVRCQDVREAKILVHDPVNEFYSCMSDEILALTYEFLLGEGLDLQLIKKCVVSSAAVKHLIALKKMEKILLKYSAEPPAMLCSKIRSISTERVQEFIKSTDTNFLFPVGLSAFLRQLTEFDFTNYVRACISQVR
jgi:hypothetical protein